MLRKGEYQAAQLPHISLRLASASTINRFPASGYQQIPCQQISTDSLPADINRFPASGYQQIPCQQISTDSLLADINRFPASRYQQIPC